LILFKFLPTQFTLDWMDAIALSPSISYCTDKLSEASRESAPPSGS